MNYEVFINKKNIDVIIFELINQVTHSSTKTLNKVILLLHYLAIYF